VQTTAWYAGSRRAAGQTEDGATIQLIASVSDITDRMHADEALHRYDERLEASVAERTRELTECPEQLTKRTHELTVARARQEAEIERRESVEDGSYRAMTHKNGNAA